MNMGGWITIITSWGLIIALACFCLYNILSKKKIK